jgi:hypothetical protein
MRAWNLSMRLTQGRCVHTRDYENYILLPPGRSGGDRFNRDASPSKLVLQRQHRRAGTLPSARGRRSAVSAASRLCPGCPSRGRIAVGALHSVALPAADCDGPALPGLPPARGGGATPRLPAPRLLGTARRLPPPLTAAEPVAQFHTSGVAAQAALPESSLPGAGCWRGLVLLAGGLLGGNALLLLLLGAAGLGLLLGGLLLVGFWRSIAHRL